MGYRRGMTTKESSDAIQTSLRVPPEMLREFDAWISDLNVGRRFGKATRNGVLLALLERALRDRPSWESLTAPPPAAPAQAASEGPPVASAPGERFVERDDNARPPETSARPKRR